MRKSYIAAVVGAAIASAAGGVAAAATGVTAANAATYTPIYMGGSSAAASGILSWIEGPAFCNSNFTEWDTDTSVVGSPDFRAVACNVTGTTVAALTGKNVVFYYRPEGGSAVGAYVAINGTTINQLNLVASDATYNSGTDFADAPNSNFMCDPNTTAAAGKLKCNVANTYINQLSGNTGTLASPPNAGTVGGDDQWNTLSAHASPMIQATLDVGVADLEPAVFGDASSPTAGPGAGNDDPANYASAFSDPVIYGPNFVGATRTVDDLSNQSKLPSHVIFQQTFAIITNKTIGGAAAPTNLPRLSVASIFGHEPGVTSTIGGNASEPDWNKVALASGAAVTAVAGGVQVSVCNREVGSGTRSAADLFLMGDGCNAVGAPFTVYDYSGNGIAGQPANNYATSLELDCVNNTNGKTPNGIGYVSVDNLTAAKLASFPNVQSVTVDNMPTTNLAGAGGATSFLYEAWMTQGKSASANGKAVFAAAWVALEKVATTSQSAQITAIPGLQGNAPAFPPAPVGATPVYVGDYTRNGNSCTVPQQQP